MFARNRCPRVCRLLLPRCRFARGPLHARADGYGLEMQASRRVGGAENALWGLGVVGMAASACTSRSSIPGSNPWAVTKTGTRSSRHGVEDRIRHAGFLADAHNDHAHTDNSLSASNS